MAREEGDEGELGEQERKFFDRLYEGARLRDSINQKMLPVEAGKDSVGDATRGMARSAEEIVVGK